MAPVIPDPLFDPALLAHVAEVRELGALLGAEAEAGRDEVPTPRRIEAARSLLRSLTRAPDDIGARVEPAEVPGPRGAVEVRVVRPVGEARGVALDVHGGGFYVGDAAMNDVRNAALADETGLVVVSVDHALAPEEPHPAGPDDVAAVLGWLLDHADSTHGAPLRMVAGQSSGANLAVLALLAHRSHPGFASIEVADLEYGVYDLSLTPSQRRSGAPAFRDLYLPDVEVGDRHDPAISPLYADLRDLPAALFTVGTADYLYDDSLFMAARWGTAGNHAELRVYPEAPHGFVSFGGAMGDHARATSVQWLRERLDATDAAPPAGGS